MDNFKINNTEIRTLRGITDFFNRNESFDLESAQMLNTKEGYKLLEMDESLSENHFLSALQVIQSKEMPGHKVRDNVKELGFHFDGNRFKKYVEYRKKNKTDSNSDVFFELKWGKEYGRIKRDEIYNNRITPYMIEYWVEKGFSKSEAVNEVEKFKSEKATSLDGFIKRHGEKRGRKMFENFQKTSKHTKEKYISKYGKKKGTRMWDEYIKTKRETSVFTSRYWINQGYKQKEAEVMRQEFHTENLNTSSVDFWINKGMSKSEAIIKVEEIFLKKRIHFGNASKESLVFFQPLYDRFSIDYEVYLGIEGSKELGIYDEHSTCMRFYDFAIPELKVIIEYHGERYHPNPDILTEEEWKNWTTMMLTTGGYTTEIKTADEMHAIDQRKKTLATSKGYDYLELWSNDSKEANNKKIEDFLLKNQIK